MSTTIDGYIIISAEYADVAETIVYMWTENFGQVIKDNSWSHWATFVSTVFIRPKKPASYYVWDEVEEEWAISQELFTPVLKDAIKDHRDSKITDTVTFNSINAFNSQEERNLIVSILAFLSANGEELPIKWKQPDGSFTTAYYADFQGLMKVGGILTQNAFMSEAHIISVHASTPYTNIQTALDDFDTYFEGL